MMSSLTASVNLPVLQVPEDLLSAGSHRGSRTCAGRPRVAYLMQQLQRVCGAQEGDLQISSSLSSRARPVMY